MVYSDFTRERKGASVRNLFSTMIVFLVVFVSSMSYAKSDLVFSLAQSTPAGGAALQQGNSTAGVFDIFIRSTTANQSFLGCDFTLTLNRADGKGGLFASGINVLMPDSSNPDGFIRGTFDQGPVSQATFSTIPNTTLTVGTTNTLLARLTMTTVNADVGSYTMSLSGLDAIDGGFNQIPTSFAGDGSLSYSIAAVPEPSSMLLAAIGAGGVAWRGRKRLLKAKA
jgi:hypothetical protein